MLLASLCACIISSSGSAAAAPEDRGGERMLVVVPNPVPNPGVEPSGESSEFSESTLAPADPPSAKVETPDEATSPEASDTPPSSDGPASTAGSVEPASNTDGSQPPTDTEASPADEDWLHAEGSQPGTGTQAQPGDPATSPASPDGSPADSDSDTPAITASPAAAPQPPPESWPLQWPGLEPESPEKPAKSRPKLSRRRQASQKSTSPQPARNPVELPFATSSEVSQNIAAILAAYPGERIDMIDAREREAKAQGKKPPSGHRILPLPSVRSEPLVGLTIGGSLTYAYRRPESSFNQVYLLLLARVSTRRVHEYRGDLEIRDIFKRQELFQLGVSVRLDPVFPYYGIANHLNLRGKKFDSRLYTSRVNTAGGYFRYQHRIIRTRRGVWRALLGYAFYSDKIRPSPGSLLYRERPQDLGTTRRGTLQAGVTWDSRDNSWNPTRGSAHDLNVTLAAPWLGSTKTWGRLSANARFFVPLGTPDLVFATKIGLDGLVGSTENLPLMALGQFGDLPGRDGFGGATIGRGFIRRRFIGRYKGLWTSELRFNAFEVKIRDRPLALGLKGFVDIARVSDKLVPDFRDFEISGGPGLFVVINRFAVVRVDVGISREFLAMYVLGSHAF